MQFFKEYNSCLIFSSQFLIQLFLIRKVGSRRSHMTLTYVYVMKPCQVIMLRSVENCDERMGKEAAVVQFEFPKTFWETVRNVYMLVCPSPGV